MADDEPKRPAGKDEIVDAILAAANRLFSEIGPADVSLRAIAREANVNHGMVHRHFGTRDDLVEQLLQRSATGWADAAASTHDFAAAIGLIMSDAGEAEATAGTWLRILAWSLLSGKPDRSSEVQRRYSKSLELLPAMIRDRDPDEAAITAAAALALVFGWRFFHPYLRAALHLDDRPFDQVHRAVYEKLLVLAES
jgi:AcrR family transcriptional regulator